jgi:hypothetical protein
MYVYSRIVLLIAAVCMAIGGLYDVFTPRLPANLRVSCNGNQKAAVVIRELLRALGGSLFAIGVSVGLLANHFARGHDPRTLAVIAFLVVPSETANVFGMCRARSPYRIPLFFLVLTVAGVALGLLALMRVE